MMPAIELPYSANARPEPNNTRNEASWIGGIGSHVFTISLNGKRLVVIAYTTSKEPVNTRTTASSRVIQNRHSDVNNKYPNRTTAVAICETPDRAVMGGRVAGVIG